MTLETSVREIRDVAERLGRPVRFMEVCGTHTMAAFRSGLRSLLPSEVALLSGPGCPVCVTPDGYVDAAVALARKPDVLVATFGDMLRVPGSGASLEQVKAERGSVRVVYSPLDALGLAVCTPEKRVVFLGVGFETTAPAIAWTLKSASDQGIANYAVLCAHKTMPRAMTALLAGGEVAVDGFLCPGHVSVVIGADAYRDVCLDHGAPCVVAGFGPADMAQAIQMLLRQLAEDRAEVEIQYTRCVSREGNAKALALLGDVFEPCDAPWRGLGVIPGSGLAIRDAYAAHDAARLYPDLPMNEERPRAGCRCGDVLRGACAPQDCGLFATRCTPATPVGACMVSSEGTCAAHYRYARNNVGAGV